MSVHLWGPHFLGTLDVCFTVEHEECMIKAFFYCLLIILVSIQFYTFIKHRMDSLNYALLFSSACNVKHEQYKTRVGKVSKAVLSSDSFVKAFLLIKAVYCLLTPVFFFGRLK